MSWTKIILINIFVMSTLIGALLLSPPLIYHSYKSLFPDDIGNADPRSDLALYKEYPWTNEHFIENHEQTVSYYDYITWRQDDYSGSTINVKKGVRSSYSDDKTINSLKQFWFFGGSTTWGEGVPDNFTFPSIFARDYEINVRNFGETGYIARQSLSYLQDLIIKSKSKTDKDKFVIFYDGVNDVSTGCNASINDNGSSRETTIRELLKYETAEGKFTVNQTFSQVIKLIKVILSKVNNKKHAASYYNCYSDYDQAYAVAKRLVSTWESAATLAEAHGMKFAAILQPVAFSGDPLVSYLNLDSYYNLILSRQYEAVYPLIKRLANESDITFFDYTAIFDGCSYCYIDFCHVGPKANQIISNALSKNILR
jgi:hypothetical protein